MKKILSILGWLLFAMMLLLSFRPDQTELNSVEQAKLQYTIVAITAASDTIEVYNSVKWRPVIVASNDSTQRFGAWMQGNVYVFDRFKSNLYSKGYTFGLSGSTGEQIQVKVPTITELPSKFE
jgi:hypothetical protein